MSAEPLQRSLQAGAEALGVPLDAQQQRQLLQYLQLLQKWNRVYNLTAVRDPQEMLQLHLLDCLAAAPGFLRELREQQARIQAQNQAQAQTDVAAVPVLDVGAGGGLPGVVLAICCAQAQVQCVDAVAKKMAFVQQAAGALGLPNLRATHARVEALPGQYPIIASRAFASLADFVTLTRQRLAPGGIWMAMKGKRPQQEIDALPPGVQVFHVEQLRVPGVAAERCIVWMRQSDGAV
ncbi:16S rRNA (guanine(527)-N(7))-methyltransferase RsmG [Vandammella animalimorsus]|uniref:Ribosomal RNA small subunit methyltransferase G n=1 Tax=Vandammella animalimorsus TaxID=2029117 RepID=A0A2A2APW9_9BURK|nr:16S rRNA (guanine(527)-N(7))-methyltransferase RsmG [Vandammella animalimorsus]PAT39744.1 16S rRNA (guanine(527)-N(7))-methyltransferase RsmG [Vandammella animalimorsus]